MNENGTQVNEPVPTRFGNLGYSYNRPRSAVRRWRSFSEEALPR